MSQSVQKQQTNQAIPENIKKELALGIKMDEMPKVAKGLSQFWSNEGIEVTLTCENGYRVAIFETASGATYKITDTGLGYGVKAETPDGDVSMKGFDTLNKATVECCEFISTINF